MYLSIKISSNTGKQIEIVEALLDSGASGKFIDQDYARNIHAERKNLEKLIQVYNVDRTPNKKGTITQLSEDTTFHLPLLLPLPTVPDTSLHTNGRTTANY